MEDNKLIAEFMGYETYEHTDSVAIRLKEGNVFSKELGHVHTKYHSSWDWLMPVVGKMNKTELWEEYSIGDLSIALVSSDMDYAYGLIVEFINHYNKIK